jgi:uncharacterized protein YecT (DUF1311 family)
MPRRAACWIAALALAAPGAASAQDEYDAMTAIMEQVLEGCLANSGSHEDDLACAGLIEEVCVAAGPGSFTTYGLNSCTGIGFGLWDDELNRLWPLVREGLAGEEAQELLEEQRAWIAETDAACEAAGAEMGGGSAVTFTINSCHGQRTAERVALFRDWVLRGEPRTPDERG